MTRDDARVLRVVCVWCMMRRFVLITYYIHSTLVYLLYLPYLPYLLYLHTLYSLGLRFLLITYVPKIERLDGMAVRCNRAATALQPRCNRAATRRTRPRSPPRATCTTCTPYQVSDAERRGRQRGAAPPPVAAILMPDEQAACNPV